MAHQDLTPQQPRVTSIYDVRLDDNGEALAADGATPATPEPLRGKRLAVRAEHLTVRGDAEGTPLARAARVLGLKACGFYLSRSSSV